MWVVLKLRGLNEDVKRHLHLEENVKEYVSRPPGAAQYQFLTMSMKEDSKESISRPPGAALYQFLLMRGTLMYPWKEEREYLIFLVLKEVL